MKYKLYSIDNRFIEKTDVPPYNFTGIIEDHNGTKQWWVNGKQHREDGPAWENPNGTKYWMNNGLCHRIDGPAIEHNGGLKYWYINGIKVTELQCKLLYDIMRLKKLM